VYLVLQSAEVKSVFLVGRVKLKKKKKKKQKLRNILFLNVVELKKLEVS
jgi:hypothetical protein